MNIVLVEPEIPQNTGNVARTCVMTSSKLYLIEPLGFSITDKAVRRSGLDYWKYLNLELHSDFSSMIKSYPQARFICFSTQGADYYHNIHYASGDFLIFGSETKGLDLNVLDCADIVARIPMADQIPRSLNLGNTVALVLYESLRQQSFPKMK